MEAKIQKGKLTVLLGKHGDNIFSANYEQDSRTLRTLKNGECIDSCILDENVSLHEFMNLVYTKSKSINN